MDIKLKYEGNEANMSTYVMSDVHGCYEKFIKMLGVIEFKSEDELYILGDIFDRGSNPLDILDYIVSHKNITLLKGNHEEFFEDYFESGDASLWYWNGGGTTHEQIMMRGYLAEEQIYKYIKKLPLFKVVDKFILVHAGLKYNKDIGYATLEDLLSIQDKDTLLWTRDNIDNEWQYRDYIVISGHTPVQAILKDSSDVKILHRKGVIYIDCGCAYEKANGKLACLRLDDMQEFYV